MEAEIKELQELYRSMGDPDKDRLLNLARDLLRKEGQPDTQPIVPAS